MAGHPISIVSKDETNAYQLDEEALRSVLMRGDVRDKPVCVVGVVGEHKSGKSFLLNFLLRYCHRKGSRNWLGDATAALQGFKWSNGIRRQTRGVQIWSEPLFLDCASGEQVAVLLVDTEGVFCRGTSQEDSVMLLGLSLFLSSVLVYNVRGEIQDEYLRNLQYFVECFKKAENFDNNSSPFQELLFLVRDWATTTQHPHGHEGGRQLLAKVRGDLMSNIQKCFQDINCYLMPYPGRVTMGREFQGRLTELSGAFMDHLEVLVPELLAPVNLTTKQFGGQTVSANYLFESFKSFFNSVKNTDWMIPSNVMKSVVLASDQAEKQVSLRSAPGAVGNNFNFGRTMSSLQSRDDNTGARALPIQVFHFGANSTVNFNIGSTVNEEIHNERISLKPHIERSTIVGGDYTNNQQRNVHMTKHDEHPITSSYEGRIDVGPSKCSLQ